MFVISVGYLMLFHDFPKFLRLFFKIGVSFCLIVWLFNRISLDEIAARWQKAEWEALVLVAPVIFCICITIYVLRWKLVLKAQELELSFWHLITIYAKGAFLGSILPGGMTSGDAYRIYSLGRYTGKSVVTISSVIMERITGIFSIVTISCLALYYSIFILHNRVLLSLARHFFVITLSFLLAAVIILFLAKKFSTMQINSRNRLLIRLHYFIAISVNVFSNKITFIKIILLSSVLQLTIIFWTYIVSEALHVGISFEVLCVTVPIIGFFTLLPISIGGLGVRETAFVFFLIPFGLEPYQAVSISIISVALQSLLRILVGSSLFLLGK